MLVVLATKRMMMAYLGDQHSLCKPLEAAAVAINTGCYGREVSEAGGVGTVGEYAFKIVQVTPRF